MRLKTIQKIVVLFIFLVIFAPATWAIPRLKVQALPQKIPIDRTLHFKIQLEWPQSEGSYDIQSTEPIADNLILLKQGQSQETGPVLTNTIAYEFQPVKTGEATIRPFEVRYRRNESEAWSFIPVPEQSMKVIGVFPINQFLWIAGSIVGILLIFGVGFYSWQRLRKIKAEKMAVPPDPKQAIYIQAREAIATFSSADSKIKLGHWSNQLKSVVMTYYNISSESATEAGIMSILKTKDLQSGELNEISRLFEQLGQLKFSRQDVPPHELDRIQKSLLQYVQGKIIIENSSS